MSTVANIKGLDYVEVCTTEPRDKHTRGDDEKAGTSTKYANI
jgi:hypothetical protein